MARVTVSRTKRALARRCCSCRSRSLERFLEDDDGKAKRWKLYPLQRAVDWFAAADARALAEDGERRWADIPRGHGSIDRPRAPAGQRRPALARPCAASTRTATTRRWIDEAELAFGQPALALVVGAELHWLDRDDYRRQALDLLVGAYRTLRRRLIW